VGICHLSCFLWALSESFVAAWAVAWRYTLYRGYESEEWYRRAVFNLQLVASENPDIHGSPNAALQVNVSVAGAGVACLASPSQVNGSLQFWMKTNRTLATGFDPVPRSKLVHRRYLDFRHGPRGLVPNANSYRSDDPPLKENRHDSDGHDSDRDHSNTTNVHGDVAVRQTFPWVTAL